MMPVSGRGLASHSRLPLMTYVQLWRWLPRRFPPAMLTQKVSVPLQPADSWPLINSQESGPWHRGSRRRLVSRAILAVIGDEIMEVAGTTQLCAGQEAGCEIGVHSMRAIFRDPSTEAILFVDASNALNVLNRQAALLNIHSLCPTLAIAVTNIYRSDSSLFIEGEMLFSSEGTT